MVDDLAALVAGAAKPWWLRALPYVIAFAAVVGVCWGFFTFGVHVEHQARVAEVAGINLKNTKALALIDATHRTQLQAATDLVRATEQKAAEDMAALDLKHTKELTNAKNKAAADVAALRAGAIRLRDNLTCAGNDGAGGDAGKASPATGVGDASTPRGLQTADAEFLLRVGAEADEVAVQLQACQAIVIQDRAGASGAPQP